MDADDKRFLRDEAVHGWEIVDGTARLCAMNLLLHGIGTPSGKSLDPTLPAVLIASDPGCPVYERLGYIPVSRWTFWHRPA